MARALLVVAVVVALLAAGCVDAKKKKKSAPPPPWRAWPDGARDMMTPVRRRMLAILDEYGESCVAQPKPDKKRSVLAHWSAGGGATSCGFVAGQFLKKLFADVLKKAYVPMGHWRVKQLPEAQQTARKAWRMLLSGGTVNGPSGGRALGCLRESSDRRTLPQPGDVFYLRDKKHPNACYATHRKGLWAYENVAHVGTVYAARVKAAAKNAYYWRTVDGGQGSRANQCTHKLTKVQRFKKAKNKDGKKTQYMCLTGPRGIPGDDPNCRIVHGWLDLDCLQKSADFYLGKSDEAPTNAKTTKKKKVEEAAADNDDDDDADDDDDDDDDEKKKKNQVADDADEKPSAAPVDPNDPNAKCLRARGKCGWTVGNNKMVCDLTTHEITKKKCHAQSSGLYLCCQPKAGAPAESADAADAAPAVDKAADGQRTFFFGSLKSAFTKAAHSYPDVAVHFPATWTDTKKTPSSVDVVVFQHGHRNCIRSVMSQGAKCSPRGAWRGGHKLAALFDAATSATGVSNALLVVPEVTVDQLSSSSGEFAKQDALKKLLAEVFSSKLAGAIGGGWSSATPSLGRVFIVSFSGGYGVTANFATRGGVDVRGIALLDSLYGSVSKYRTWMQSTFTAQAPADARFINLFLGSTTRYSSAEGGWATKTFGARAHYSASPKSSIDADDMRSKAIYVQRATGSHGGAPEKYFEAVCKAFLAKPSATSTNSAERYFFAQTQSLDEDVDVDDADADADDDDDEFDSSL